MRNAEAICALLCLASACGGGNGSAQSGDGPSGTLGWEAFHWARTANPLTVRVGDGLSDARWRQILLESVSVDWSASDVIDMAVVDAEGCEAVDGLVQVCNGEFGLNGWLGLATVWVDKDRHIVRGVVKMNDSYFTAEVYDNPIVRRHVLCQEVGHTLGLDHQPTVGCMNDGEGILDPTYAGPSDDDYRRLEEIYGHTDDHAIELAEMQELSSMFPAF